MTNADASRRSWSERSEVFPTPASTSGRRVVSGVERAGNGRRALSWHQPAWDRLLRSRCRRLEIATCAAPMSAVAGRSGAMEFPRRAGNRTRKPAREGGVLTEDWRAEAPSTDWRGRVGVNPPQGVSGFSVPRSGGMRGSASPVVVWRASKNPSPSVNQGRPARSRSSPIATPSGAGPRRHGGCRSGLEVPRGLPRRRALPDVTACGFPLGCGRTTARLLLPPSTLAAGHQSKPTPRRRRPSRRRSADSRPARPRWPLATSRFR